MLLPVMSVLDAGKNPSFLVHIFPMRKKFLAKKKKKKEKTSLRVKQESKSKESYKTQIKFPKSETESSQQYQLLAQSGISKQQDENSICQNGDYTGVVLQGNSTLCHVTHCFAHALSLYPTDTSQYTFEGFRPLTNKNQMTEHTSSFQYVCNIASILTCVILSYSSSMWLLMSLTLVLTLGTTKGFLFHFLGNFFSIL